MAWWGQHENILIVYDPCSPSRSGVLSPYEYIFVDSGSLKVLLFWEAAAALRGGSRMVFYNTSVGYSPSKYNFQVQAGNGK